MNLLTTSIFIPILFSFRYVNTALSSDDIRNYLGTRTAYRFRYNTEDSKIKFSNCKDVKIWMVVRHGTRLPSAKDILGMNTTLYQLKNDILGQHKLGNGELTEEELEHLAAWSSDLDVENEKDLTIEGQEEMIDLAQRMKKRLPNAIKSKYSNESFLFRYTATQRAEVSAKSFAEGLFDKKQLESVSFTPALKIDPVLRFYKHCDRWQREVKKNIETYREQRLLGESTEMNNTLEAISRRLGLDYVLSIDKVNLMYKICGYETAYNKDRMSPWCYAFDEESIKVLEYYHDLKHYWMDGYGYDLTHRLACLSMQHLIETFTNETKPTSTFLFAHSGTLLKILSHLQLYKPARPLRGDVIDGGRPWRASIIDCFATNLAFVLFKCKKEHYILTLHQERIVKLPMCDQELCPLSTFVKYFKTSVHNCDYSDMCQLKRDEL